jgi:hypothetical protein
MLVYHGNFESFSRRHQERRCLHLEAHLLQRSKFPPRFQNTAKISISHRQTSRRQICRRGLRMTHITLHPLQSLINTLICEGQARLGTTETRTIHTTLPSPLSCPHNLSLVLAYLVPQETTPRTTALIAQIPTQIADLVRIPKTPPPRGRADTKTAVQNICPKTPPTTPHHHHAPPPGALGIQILQRYPHQPRPQIRILIMHQELGLHSMFWWRKTIL